VVTVMKEIVISMLQQFRANRGALPEHIFLFRDGISEGQYRFVSVHSPLPSLSSSID
jgi:hypothetical protein